MQPLLWQPSINLSAKEEQIINQIKKAKLFVFLRQNRHCLFDETFQGELAQMYQVSGRGHPPIAPAQLALAIILQAYTGVSDDEVIEVTLMDRRWQLVLDCLDTEQAPFSKGICSATNFLIQGEEFAEAGILLLCEIRISIWDDEMAFTFASTDKLFLQNFRLPFCFLIRALPPLTEK